MAVPFFVPEGGADDIASSSSGASGNSSPHNHNHHSHNHNHAHPHPHTHPPLSAHSSSGASSSSSSSSSSASSASSSAGSSSGVSSGSSSASSDGASSVASQSPNTTSSATQTPMQSPLPTDQVLYALCEWVRIYQSQQQSASQIFQYPPPPSPSCNYTGGDVFFPHGPPNPHPRTPRTSVSFSAGEEYNFFRQPPHHAPPYPAPSTPQPMPPQPPQSAPAMHCSHSYPQQSAPHLMQHHSMPYGPYYASYTPPPTPNTASAATATTSSSSASGAAFGCWPQSQCHGHGPIHSPALASTPLAPKMRLQRSQSDAARRKRLTSTGEDEYREYQSDHEASWDDPFDYRYDNFTAGRERLQEFNGRIPPRKKKSVAQSSSSSTDASGPCNSGHPVSQLSGPPHANSNPEQASASSSNQGHRERRTQAEKKKPHSFTWPTVVTVFVLAMGCGFFAAR
ncbi:hypothetical protein KR018_011394 [Drosophila ironensis]|nr:hypothetical protein KR018_011394 [Drosophila ironensis]